MGQRKNSGRLFCFNIFHIAEALTISPEALVLNFVSLLLVRLQGGFWSL